MIATGPYWWYVNIGSGNGLVPPGNKPLPEPVLTQDLQRHMASLGPNELKSVILNIRDAWSSSWPFPKLLRGETEHNKTPLYWQVNTGSGKGLLLSGSKPLAEPMFTQIYGVTRPQWVSGLNTCFQTFAEDNWKNDHVTTAPHCMCSVWKCKTHPKSLGWTATSATPVSEVTWPRSRFNTSGPDPLGFDWEGLAASRGTAGGHSGRPLI